MSVRCRGIGRVDHGRIRWRRLRGRATRRWESTDDDEFNNSREVKELVSGKVKMQYNSTTSMTICIAEDAQLS
jgi:hypothetical protein